VEKFTMVIPQNKNFHVKNLSADKSDELNKVEK
jgi:hypothetical protein